MKLKRKSKLKYSDRTQIDIFTLIQPQTSAKVGSAGQVS